MSDLEANLREAQHLVSVRATVPVYITVDLATGAVDQVVVDDENLEFDDGDDAVLTEWHLKPVPTAAREKALRLVRTDRNDQGEEIEWPSWSFG